MALLVIESGDLAKLDRIKELVEEAYGPEGVYDPGSTDEEEIYDAVGIS